MLTQNSFTKIKSVLRFLAVCGTVLGGRNAHDGFENTVKMIDIIETTGVADVQHTVVCLREHFHGLTDTLFVTTEPAPTTVWSPNTTPGQNGGIHTDPAVFAKHDVFAGLMLLQIGQHMVRRDKTDIRRDITAFANDDFGGEILKIAAERVKLFISSGSKIRFSALLTSLRKETGNGISRLMPFTFCIHKFRQHHVQPRLDFSNQRPRKNFLS